MKLVKRTARYAIFDDVLDAKAFAALWSYVQLDDYVSVHSQHWEKVWRLSDGQPLTGVVVTATVPGAVTTRSGGSQSQARIYPTHLAIDALFDKLLSASGELAEVVGTAGTDYVAVNARPYLYPAGSALSWHQDAGHYSGAFSYYAHPRWNATWGGELIFADESTANRDLGAKQTTTVVFEGERAVGLRKVWRTPALDYDRENEVLCESGWGEFVNAKPNRLVIFGGATPHRIARVDPCAGENVRCSISGFFIAADRKS